MSRDVPNDREEPLVAFSASRDGPVVRKKEGGSAVFERATRMAERVEHGLAVVGWIAMFLIMILVTLDVGMRYFFNSPLRWSFDFVSLYLMPSVFFLALTDTMRHKEHVSVDIAYLTFPSKLKNVCDVVIYAAAASVFIFLFYVSARATFESFSRGEVVSGLIPWPVWAGYAAAPIGSLPVALFCVARLFTALVRVATGRRDSEDARAH